MTNLNKLLGLPQLLYQVKHVRAEESTLRALETLLLNLEIHASDSNLQTNLALISMHNLCEI